MTTSLRLDLVRPGLFLACGVAWFAPRPGSAQVAPAAASEPALLVRYDLNRNGRLDPEELAAVDADRARQAPVATAGAAAGETLVLSPFEVVADTRGYQAANTMSGTRLNTKLEDLASAISVITKEQMADFAMLDINDVFLYGANTEGTGTFTDFIVGDGQGGITDNVAGDPANANRVRGIGNANVSVGNFETSNRVPIDPIDADAVEINRGPNANIFGLGNAAGTVNIVSAAANVQRDRAQVALRADSFDGWRSSLDVNRVLLRDRLGVRVSAVRQHDGFDLKPSGVNTTRYNGMVQVRPFKGTTLNASFQHYRAHGNRPNALPPLDAISDWRAAGSPTWDPLTDTMKINGVFSRNGTPAYLFTQAGNIGQVFVDRSGIGYWSASYGTADLTPLGAIQANRKIVVTRARVNDAQPLIGRRVEMVSDKEMYDWSSINLSAPNRFEDRTGTTRVTLDQILFESKGHSLAAQIGWFREDSERRQRYFMGEGDAVAGQLLVDVNERLLDGRANPYFMRPAVTQQGPQARRMPLLSDTYRGQLAYQLDFTASRSWRRWLGAHHLVGYAEYKDRVERTYRFVHALASDNPWLFSSPTADRSTNTVTRANLRFYLGDNQGQNVDYAPGSLAYGNYTYVWGNPNTGAVRAEPVTMGEVPSGNASGSQAIQKTGGAILQSRLLQGRLIGTFGRREDRHFTRFQNPTRLADRGMSYDYDYMNRWRDEDWQLRTGSTEQRGVVVKPFYGWGPIDRHAEQAAGLTRFFGGALRGLSLHYNRSDSFKPAAPAQNVFGRWLPDPGGKGKDYGFALNLFDNRLVVRVNKYETKQINSRSGASAGFAKSLWAMDYISNAFGLQQEATEWITEMAAREGRTLTPAQLDAELTRVMGVPPRDRGLTDAIPTSETDDVIGRGHEVEIHFNPTRYWTLKADVTEKQTINARLAPNVTVYSAQRLPFWEKIVDPRTGARWWTTLYGGSETPFAYYRRVVANPLNVAQATEGLARPQIRRYTGSLTTNFRLSGITDHSILKAINVGGAVRYESKGAIGYYGLQQLPAIIEDYDISRPIWDKGHVYVDAFVGYRTRLWRNKVGATFQLNVRNVGESGRLQPIAAYPDGTPNSFRIVSPRQFILSTTFEM